MGSFAGGPGGHGPMTEVEFIADDTLEGLASQLGLTGDAATEFVAQIERYNVLNYGPSNVNALADDTISSNLALQALNAQSAFAVSQMVLGGFWTPAEAFGAELEAHSTGDLQTMLDRLVEQALAG